MDYAVFDTWSIFLVEGDRDRLSLLHLNLQHQHLVMVGLVGGKEMVAHVLVMKEGRGMREVLVMKGALVVMGGLAFEFPGWTPHHLGIPVVEEGLVFLERGVF